MKQSWMFRVKRKGEAVDLTLCVDGGYEDEAAARRAGNVTIAFAWPQYRYDELYVETERIA